MLGEARTDEDDTQTEDPLAVDSQKAVAEAVIAAYNIAARGNRL